MYSNCISDFRYFQKGHCIQSRLARDRVSLMPQYLRVSHANLSWTFETLKVQVLCCLSRARFSSIGCLIWVGQEKCQSILALALQVNKCTLCALVYRAKQYCATQKLQWRPPISLKNNWFMFSSLPAGEWRFPGKPGVECVRYSNRGLGEGWVGHLHLLAKLLPGTDRI